MGRERTGTRKFVYVCIACLILSLAACCTGDKEKKNSNIPDIPKEKTQNDIPDIPKEKTQFELSAEHILHAQKLLAQGDYEETLRESMKALSLSGKNSPGDEALFTMGLVYAHYKNPKKNFDEAIGFFERLVREYPQSPLLEQSQIWIGILKLIRQSTEVDIQIEEIKKGLSK
ncbi:MAG TPA: hypothetical protein VEJ88_06675 [Dissulfurispiraceae bacterium]|nr:hypothetical protein [Dissulfurispiraceae bacterium]